MDDDHLSGLLLARGLLDRARASVNGTGPGAMAAVVLFDLAVETAGKTALGSSVSHEISFQELLKKLNSAARTKSNSELIGHGRMTKLRKLRNGVQHDGNEPSARDVERAGVWAEEFIDELARRFFDLPLRELSRASLITDPEARASVVSAEALAAQEKYGEAAALLAVAFEQAHAAFRDREPWRRRMRMTRSQIERSLQGLSGKRAQSSRRSDLEKLLRAIPAKGISTFTYGEIAESVFPRKPADVKPLAKLIEELLNEVARIDQRVEAFAVAGDPGEYAWFRQRVRRPTLYAGDGSIQYRTYEPDAPFSQQDYLRALDFVLGAAVRWQQTPAEPEPEVIEDIPDEPEEIEAGPVST